MVKHEQNIQHNVVVHLLLFYETQFDFVRAASMKSFHELIIKTTICPSLNYYYYDFMICHFEIDQFFMLNSH